MSMILDPYRFGGGGGGGGSDPYFSSVVSLLHFDGADASTTFTDVKGKTWTAGGAAQLDTANPKFGTAAGLFNGSNSIISTPHHSDFQFGTGDFTIEMFLDPAALSGYGTIFAKWDGGGGGRSLILYHNGGNLEFYYSTTGGDTNAMFTAPVLSTSGGYVHLAIVRDGQWIRSYVGGVNCQITGSASSADKFINTASIYTGGTRPFCIGGQSPNAFGWFNGHIDEFRVTKGVCRYPGATTFTPPSSPFPDS